MKDILELKSRVEHFKKFLMLAFSEPSNTGIYILKVHLLDHVVGDLFAFDSHSVLDTSLL